MLEQCVTADEVVEAAKIHEPPTIIAKVTKTVLPHHMQEQVVARAHPGIQGFTMSPLGSLF